MNIAALFNGAGVVFVADSKFRIWDAYWQDSRIYSAGVDSDPAIAQTLDQNWQLLARALPAGMKVLDIACGNGSASLALTRGAQEAGVALDVTGIDSAAIDPARYVPEHADLLRQIAFHGLTDMEEMPFAPDTFDVAISQYGLEYGNVRNALAEAYRVLKPYGLLTALCLPARSAAVHAAHRSLKQSRELLRGGELFVMALAIVNDLHHAEHGGETDSGEILRPFNSEVERVVRKFGNEECDVVFAIVLGLQKIFIDRKTTALEDQVAAIQTLRTRLAEYAARAQSLTRAALSDANLEDFKRQVTSVGFKLTEVKPILVGAHGTVAWRISAERFARAA